MKIQRWRITFEKTEAMRFTSHLDLILTWERTFRRSGLPLSYSEGFNPRPVINLAAPLPLGFTSKGEIGDFWLSENVTETTFSESLERSLPPGLKIKEFSEIKPIHGGKLPSLVKEAVYQMRLIQDYPNLETSIKKIVNLDKLIRTRKGKEYDLRPLIHELHLVKRVKNSAPVLETRLSLLPGATGRPDEVLLALNIPPLEALIIRMKILLRSTPPKS